MTKAVLKGFIIIIIGRWYQSILSAPKLVSLSWKYNVQFLCRKAELNYILNSILSILFR